MADIETAVREHMLSEWSEFEIEGFVSELADLDEEQITDPEHIAHSLWRMGAHGPKHRGCNVDNDSTYKNECDPCQGHLLVLADKIIASICTGSETGADRG